MKRNIPHKFVDSWSNLFLFFILITSFSAKANSLAGGSLRYEPLGNNTYLVTLEIIRDCAGGNAPFTEILNISSFSCNFSQMYTMNTNSNFQIFSECSSRPSTCNGGIYLGLQKWSYTVIIPLPASCSDWIFSVRDFSLSAGITTIQNPDSNYFYIDAGLNNIGQDNQSIQLNNSGVGVFCVGQTNILNMGVFDLEGDSLYFSLTDLQTDANTSAQYNSGYSAINPVTSTPPLSIDTYTGDLTINPTDTSEFGIAAIKIFEYRNGNVIGFSTVYYPLLIYPCNINSNLMTCPFSALNVEATEQFCYDITAIDPPYPDDTITMSWNQSIPGAVFTFTSLPHPIGHFCWTPTVNDISPQPYTFIVSTILHSCVGAQEACIISLIVTPFTGIEAIENKNGFNIFPNPTTGLFNISADSKLKIHKVIISDLLGKVILESYTQSGIDLNGFINGIYFVKAENKDGTTFFEKIIKQ